MKVNAEKQIILITGASSFTGRYVINQLLLKSQSMLVLTSRKPETLSSYQNPRIHITAADLTNPQSFKAIFETYPITTVIHLAAMARLREGEQNPAEAININLIGTLALKKLAAEYGVDTFVFTSSDLAREATSVVGMCKYLIEEAFRLNEALSPRLVTIRMPNITDSSGAVTLLFKKQIEQDGPVTITHKKMSRRFVSGENAAKIICHAALSGNHHDLFVNLDKATNILDLAKQMILNSGKTIEVKTIGAQPGERLAEKGYLQEKVNLSTVHGWGTLKNNEVNFHETGRMVKALIALLSPENNGLIKILKTEF